MKQQLPSKAEMKRHAKEFAGILQRLQGEGVPFITAIVMAGDIQTANRADELLAQGIKARDIVWRVGSYARFDWAVKHLPKRTLFALLPELWIASDPDDTKPEYLALWIEAKRRNKGQAITDNEPLPVGKITIYRGQIGDKLGISWTLNKVIAEKFARTGGGRGSVAGGQVIRRRINSTQALAYLTGRNESEVIYDCYA